MTNMTMYVLVSSCFFTASWLAFRALCRRLAAGRVTKSRELVTSCMPRVATPGAGFNVTKSRDLVTACERLWQLPATGFILQISKFSDHLKANASRYN